jgi:serine protease
MRTTRRKTTKDLRSENGPLRVTGVKEKRRGVVAGLAGAFLSLALGSCGGSGGGDTTAQTTQQLKEPQTLEQTASLAATNPTTPLALSLKMNTSSLGADASVDRFIIKYKDGTAESGSTMAVQSRLNRLAGSLPSKARYRFRPQR